MIERKIDEVQVSENVDDAAAMAELAHTLHPGVVDLDVVEKAMIESRESGVRLVGLRQLALGHGFARERGETMILPRRRPFFDLWPWPASPVPVFLASAPRTVS